jgi:hypothetical protein
MVQAYFRHRPLKAGAIIGRPAALALILLDDHHTVRQPAEPFCELSQGVLAFAGLAVLENLLRR